MTGSTLPPPASAGGTVPPAGQPRLVTHGHPDHTGGVRETARYLADHNRLSGPVDLTAPSWWRPQ